eukprot:703007-Amphidinium_carterae.1
MSVPFLLTASCACWGGRLLGATATRDEMGQCSDRLKYVTLILAGCFEWGQFRTVWDDDSAVLAATLHYGGKHVRCEMLMLLGTRVVLQPPVAHIVLVCCECRTFFSSCEARLVPKSVAWCA